MMDGHLDPIIVRDADRPQPRLDRNAGNGMSVSVGRIREGIRYMVMGHIPHKVPMNLRVYIITSFSPFLIAEDIFYVFPLQNSQN